MKKSTIPYTVGQLKKMYETTKLLEFDCPIQRRYGMWNETKKSLLIHSMLVNYVIPPLYMQKENRGVIDKKGRNVSNYSCIDGQHRLLSIFAFMNDEFSLDVTTPNVEVDGEDFVIAGMKYSDLSTEIQQMIQGYYFTIYNLEECTDEEIEEMFFRLNNGSELSKTQMANVKLGMSIAKFVKETLNRRFFTEVCHFTQAQYRRAADEKSLLQAMLLLDVKDDDYDLTSFSEGEIIQYADTLHGNYSSEKRERVTNVIDYLEEAFEHKEKFMKVINVPMFIYMADQALSDGISASDFYEWFKQFSEKYNPDCEYAQYCSTGSIKKDKVNGRIVVLENDYKNFFSTESAEDYTNMKESSTPITDDFMNDAEETEE